MNGLAGLPKVEKPETAKNKPESKIKTPMKIRSLIILSLLAYGALFGTALAQNMGNVQPVDVVNAPGVHVLNTPSNPIKQS